MELNAFIKKINLVTTGGQAKLLIRSGVVKLNGVVETRNKKRLQKGDIVEVLDALCDITYVSLGNGVMLHGLKDKIWPAYQEVQGSNMSKSCSTQEEAMETVTLRSKEQAEPCHFEQVKDRFVVYRTRDRKVMKSINYYRPDLKQFFTQEELKKEYL